MRFHQSVVATLFAALPAMANTFPNGMCWDQKKIPIAVNMTLAFDLHNPRNQQPPSPSAGDAKGRMNALHAAVDAWNNALQVVGSKKRLVVVPTEMPPWATEQAPALECTDADTKLPVFAPTYLRTSPDDRNSVSTGAPTRSRQPGWIVGAETPESYQLCQRLGETKLIPPPSDKTAKFIQEADITYFTHVRAQKGVCSAIAWDYRMAAKVAPAYYDFYSVMLHELGHVLGLDHMNCADEQTNVMQSKLMTGDRTRINACELTALQSLYGNGGRCADAP